VPNVPAFALSLFLAAVLHLDWHLARPAHHRLSLEWSYHWLATAVIFGLVGWLIARKWAAAKWTLGAVVFLAAVVIAQGVEPFLEVLFYEGRIGYSSEPLRWAAFGRAIGAATPFYWGAIWLCAQPRSELRAT
jgi:hypothetical protein